MPRDDRAVVDLLGSGLPTTRRPAGPGRRVPSRTGDPAAGYAGRGDHLVTHGRLVGANDRFPQVIEVLGPMTPRSTGRGTGKGTN